MSSLVFSICIPTYNRARYLAVLLEKLSRDLVDFPFTYEIVISDNASPDNTTAVVGSYSDKLPIKYFRKDENCGGMENYAFTMEQARGDLILYLADDDFLDIPALTPVVQRMIDDPEIAVVFAPWKMANLTNGHDFGQFYRLDQEYVVEKGDYAQLAKIVTLNKAFPEIGVYRRKVFMRLRQRENMLAYWAFTNLGNYNNLGKIVFSPKPFYIAIMQYFADDNRQQMGHLEVEDAWDRYRGGLETLVGRAMDKLTPAEVTAVREGIHDMIMIRIAVALKFRWQLQKDPIDCYYLACRLRGMGGSGYLPVPFSNITVRAALYYVATDKVLLSRAKQIVCVGPFADNHVAALQGFSSLPVSVVPTFPESLENALVLLSGELADHALDEHELSTRGVRLVAERDLLRRFS